MELQVYPDPARKLSANPYDIYHCCVYSEKLLMMDRGTVRNQQSFVSKNKFEKLVHLVGFIIRNLSRCTVTWTSKKDICWQQQIEYCLFIYLFIYFAVALRPNAGHGHPILEISRSHTTTHHSRQDSFGRVISSSQRPLPDNTQHSQQKNIHAPRWNSNPRSQQVSGRRPTSQIAGPLGPAEYCLSLYKINLYFN